MAYHVGKTRFAELVDLALEDVPESFRDYLEEVRIEIADTPTAKQAASVGLKSNGLLLGLYQGRPRTNRSVTIKTAAAKPLAGPMFHRESGCEGP